MVAGIHLEGPFISAEDGAQGAHPAVHCRPPDLEEFELLAQAAEGQIRLVTMSPEYDGAAPFIAELVARGVRVAIGHTSANAAQIRARSTRAPRSARTWAMVPTPSCAAIRIISGTNWPKIASRPA